MWDGLPLVARLLLLALAAAILGLLALPLVHWIRLQRRIRKLPPPVVIVKVEPELRLPRRNPDQPPEV